MAGKRKAKAPPAQRGRRSAYRQPGEPPRSERRRRLAAALAAGMTNAEAARRAGYRGVKAERGITASQAKRDPWVQEQIAKGRKRFEEAAYAGLFHVLAALGAETARKRGAKALSLKDAVQHALSRQVLQASGLLAPDTTPPPSASALADAILGSVPPEKLGALLVRAGEAIQEGQHEDGPA
jgi:hypothetical protein